MSLMRSSWWWWWGYEICSPVDDDDEEEEVSRLWQREVMLHVWKHVTTVHKQKWLLLFNLDEAYSLFKQWYLYVSVGFSSFFEIRPRNVVNSWHMWSSFSMAHTSQRKTYVNRKSSGKNLALVVKYLHMKTVCPISYASPHYQHTT